MREELELLQEGGRNDMVTCLTQEEGTLRRELITVCYFYCDRFCKILKH